LVFKLLESTSSSKDTTCAPFVSCVKRGRDSEYKRKLSYMESSLATPCRSCTEFTEFTELRQK